MSDFGLRVAIADTVKEMLGETLERGKATSAAISKDGSVLPEAVRNAIPWLAHDGVIEGAVTTGTNHLRWPFPQGGMIRYVSIDAKTPPGASGMTITISGGASTQLFALQAGEFSSGFPANIPMAPGSWARVNVTTAGDAADVAITILYTSAGTSGGGGGTGGSGGGGGAVVSVNGQTGVVALTTDDVPDTSATHKYVTSSDLNTIANLGNLAFEDAIDIADINASGTPNAGTYLSGAGVWTSPAGGGGGDMLASVFDPGNVSADAFDMDNMAEGSTAKILTAAERTKLSGIAPGAEVNVQSDWNAGSGDAHILNKPNVKTISRVQNQNNSVGEDDVAVIITQPGILLTPDDGFVYIGPDFGSGSGGDLGSSTQLARRDHTHNALLAERLPKTDSNRASASLAVSSGTYHEVSGAAVTFTGLVPNAAYTVRTDTSLMAGTAGRMAVVARVVGATTVRQSIPAQQDLRGTNNQVFHESSVVTVNANGSGQIVVTPEAFWVSGSFSVWWASVVATVMKV